MTDSTHPGYLTLTSPGHAIAEGVVTIELPGLTAIRIDTRTRTIAVDGISGEACRAEPLLPEWLIADLRGGMYGDFHRMTPRDDCPDRDCADSGQHTREGVSHARDIVALNLHFQGYPVTLVSDGVMALLGQDSHSVASRLSSMLRFAQDTAEPGEPSGWIFESQVGGTTVCVERFGGIRSEDSHEGGQWSVYMPSER